jgi:hypothetical protein
VLAQPRVGTRAGLPVHHELERAVEFGAGGFEVPVLDFAAAGVEMRGWIRR